MPCLTAFSTCVISSIDGNGRAARAGAQAIADVQARTHAHLLKLRWRTPAPAAIQSSVLIAAVTAGSICVCISALPLSLSDA
jgi:hypothetical protein